MTDTPQKRALHNDRTRLGESGMARFEVLGLDADRDLIRKLARRLAGKGEDAQRIRASVTRSLKADKVAPGKILAALRRSPLVGAGLDMRRSGGRGRKVSL
jgi:hypothetical protein